MVKVLKDLTSVTSSTSSTLATTTKLYEEEEDNEESAAVYEPSAPKVKVLLVPLDFKPSTLFSVLL